MQSSSLLSATTASHQTRRELFDTVVVQRREATAPEPSAVPTRVSTNTGQRPRANRHGILDLGPAESNQVFRFLSLGQLAELRFVHSEVEAKVVGYLAHGTDVLGAHDRLDEHLAAIGDPMQARAGGNDPEAFAKTTRAALVTASQSMRPEELQAFATKLFDRMTHGVRGQQQLGHLGAIAAALGADAAPFTAHLASLIRNSADNFVDDPESADQMATARGNMVGHALAACGDTTLDREAIKPLATLAADATRVDGVALVRQFARNTAAMAPARSLGLVSIVVEASLKQLPVLAAKPDHGLDFHRLADALLELLPRYPAGDDHTLDARAMREKTIAGIVEHAASLPIAVRLPLRKNIDPAVLASMSPSEQQTWQGM